MTSNNILIIEITLTLEAFILSVRHYSTTFKVDTTRDLNFEFRSVVMNLNRGRSLVW